MNSQQTSPSTNRPTENGSTVNPAASISDTELHTDVRLALRSHRHDLAGRVQAVMGSAELLDDPTLPLPIEIAEAVGLLKNIVTAWRNELVGLDTLLSGEINRGPASSTELQKILSSVDRLPDTRWACGSELFGAALRHAHKTVGRSGFHRLRMTVRVAEQLVVDVVAGDEVSMFDSSSPRRVAEVFAGDLEGSLTEAHAHAAGVSASAVRTEHGAGIRFIIARA